MGNGNDTDPKLYKREKHKADKTHEPQRLGGNVTFPQGWTDGQASRWMHDHPGNPPASAPDYSQGNLPPAQQGLPSGNGTGQSRGTSHPGRTPH